MGLQQEFSQASVPQYSRCEVHCALKETSLMMNYSRCPCWAVVLRGVKWNQVVLALEFKAKTISSVQEREHED